MKRSVLPVIALVFLATFVGQIIWHSPPAAADFNASNLIDDSVFNNTSSMDAAAIDSWLNGNFPGSCISTNHGFAAQDPTGYTPSGGYTYGGNVSAGHVIYDSAAAYGLNPQVLLATLQKEQSLVSGGSGCNTLAYVGAMGYGCPDSGTTHSYSGLNLYSINGAVQTAVSGTCVNSAAKAGFSEQVIHAAWLLKFGQQRSEGNTGFNVQLTNAPQPGDIWNNSDDPPTCYAGPMTQGSYKRCSSDTSSVYYDGYTTIDGSSTHMDTGSTAALYWYTPHFSGNQHFDTIFSGWFGSLYGDTIGSSAYRLYNSKTRTHYYTAKQNERATAKSSGFSDDGTAFNVASTPAAGMVPIYNLYQYGINDDWLVPDGMNFYWGVVKSGYTNQGVAFYAYPVNTTPGGPICQAGTVPVYQMWQGGASEHFYSTSNMDHYWSLIYGGYVDDGSSTYRDGSGGVSFCVPQ